MLSLEKIIWYKKLSVKLITKVLHSNLGFSYWLNGGFCEVHVSWSVQIKTDWSPIDLGLICWNFSCTRRCSVIFNFTNCCTSGFPMHKIFGLGPQPYVESAPFELYAELIDWSPWKKNVSELVSWLLDNNWIISTIVENKNYLLPGCKQYFTFWKYWYLGWECC